MVRRGRAGMLFAEGALCEVGGVQIWFVLGRHSLVLFFGDGGFWDGSLVMGLSKFEGCFFYRTSYALFLSGETFACFSPFRRSSLSMAYFPLQSLLIRSLLRLSRLCSNIGT